MTCRPPWRPCRPSPGYRQHPGIRPCWQRTRCPSGCYPSPSAPRGWRTRARCSTPPPPPCQRGSRRSSPVGIHNLYIDTVVVMNTQYFRFYMFPCCCQKDGTLLSTLLGEAALLDVLLPAGALHTVHGEGFRDLPKLGVNSWVAALKSKLSGD